MARIAQADPIHLGLDVHRDSISVATLHPDQTAADIERIPHDEAAVLQLIGRFAQPTREVTPIGRTLVCPGFYRGGLLDSCAT
jgi:hypothetical protein